MPPPSPTGSTDPDDQRRLIKEARGGSREALGQLLELIRPHLVQTAYLPSKARGSDLVQQTFQEARQNFHRFEGTTEAELVDWLRHIFHHNLANLVPQYRERAKRDLGREVSLGADTGAHQGVDGLPGSDPSPSGIAAARERDAGLERAIARLSVEYRQVLVWRNRERLSYAEIGVLLNCSAEAARKLWCRALELLREELGPES